MNLRPFGGALLALVALGSISAVPHTPSNFVADTAQEADVAPPPLDSYEKEAQRFPRANPSYIKALYHINKTVNEKMTYVRDIDQYGVSEKWVWLPESLKGDCEDYALTKLAILQKAQFPTIERARITMLRVKGTGHAVLEVLVPGAGVLVMDNNFDRLMTRRELILDHGYTFYDW